MSEQRELELVRTFVQVVQRGGFTAAAEVLGVPRSSVSRRVARLEGRLVRGPAAEPFVVYALYPPVRPVPGRLRVFVDFLVEWFRGQPLSG